MAKEAVGTSNRLRYDLTVVDGRYVANLGSVSKTP